MKRIEHDDYPTPPDVVEALRRALSEHLRLRHPEDLDWIDPAAGSGTLLEWLGVSRGRRHAIELRPEAAPLLSRRVAPEQMRVGVDALTVPWPDANIVANPPFALLDAFVRRILAELRQPRWPHPDEPLPSERYAAVLMPTQWLQAQKRADIPPPQEFWPLRWRPSFRGEGGGAAHDVAWAVWLWRAQGRTTAAWLPRPPVPRAHLDTFRAILGGPKQGALI